IAVDCLHYQENERPSSEELCQRLAELKSSSEYSEGVDRISRHGESTTRVESKVGGGDDSQLDQLHMELQRRDRLLEEKESQIQQKDEKIKRLFDEIASKDNAIQKLRGQLQASNEPFQIRQKPTNLFVNQTKSATVPVPERQQRFDATTKQEELHKTRSLPQRSTSSTTTGQKMALGKWKSHLRGAPFRMVKADSVVIGDVAYFMYIDGSVCAYNSRSKDWKKLPPCPLQCGSLADVRNHLTAIGGSETSFGAPENNLYSLTIADTDKKQPKLWEERFPPMPTKRCCTSSVSTKQHLIVAGGTNEGGTSLALRVVEVMDIETLLWSEAASLPHTFSSASVTVCGDRLYLLGGVKDNFKTKSVLICSLKELIRSCSNEEEAPLTSSMDSVWHRAANFLVFYSICASIGEELVAVGGVDDFDNTVPAVFKYDLSTDSWSIISNMPTARHDCFVAVLPTNMMMVVGGCKEFTRSLTDKVEIVRIL
ncbi:MAG: hypothetical protein MJE68_18075, partial [Proteobacteria bacterium]|nr:hypothetical protein [Pseudomonadota bacterium]